jgi:hypothetical protein
MIKFKFCLVLLICAKLTSSFAQNQYFSGKITYQNLFFSLAGKDITLQVNKMMGAEQFYYTNAHNYKSELNGTAITSLIYNGKSNTLYTIFPNNTAQKVDGITQSDSIVKITYFEKDTVISERKCKGLSMEGLKSSYIYYYDPLISVEVENFKDHNYGNWNDYLVASKGALPILYITKTPYFNWVAKASKIEELEILDDFFELPKDISIK